MTALPDNQPQSPETSEQPADAVAAFQCGRFLDLHAEIDLLRADTASREESGHKTRMLVKYPEFRIVLIFMRASSRWDDHQTKARIFVSILRGRIRFHTPDGACDLRPGQLFSLDPGIIHSVDALEESAFLLTLSDPREAAQKS